MYLREMGTVPLLTREGEVEIAKRIERGQLRVLKALSRSPIVIRELLAMGEDLKKGVRSIKEVVTFDEEEITDEILQNRLNEFTGKIDDMAKLYKKATSARREVPRSFEDEEAEGSSPGAPQAGARHRCRVAGGAQARFHQRRAQAADRTPEQDGRRHAFARPPDAESRAQGRRHSQRRAEERISPAGARDSRRSRKARTRNRRVVSGAQAHPARNHPGRHGCGAGQARADRGQPPPGGFDRQEIHQPRTCSSST